MSALWVEITATRGSAPRDAGTAMKVTATDLEGTIGGGALEHRAIATARRLLAQGGDAYTETIPLGPGLGQCCGGAVSLRYTRTECATDNIAPVVLHGTARTPPAGLWIWGAGHVGRAVVRACPPDAFALTWIDSARDRFPAQVPDHVTVLPAADMPRLAQRAPEGVQHLIFTYSHDIDLALCAALLHRSAAGIGLIGSQTKRARFFSRLRAMGLDPEGITCPIGEKTFGKAPDRIAYGTVQHLLAAADARETA
jgi:xanthine dehydrogenase accessory factor